MRSLLTALVLATALGLAACGDGEETTVVSTTTVSGSASSTTVADDGAVEGVMTANGVGEASVGDSAEDVIAALGEPDEDAELPGCELDANPVPVRQLSYELEGGRLAVNVDTETGEMTDYFTDSSAIETEHGDRVGDSWESLSASWGAALDPVPIGAKPSPEAGIYKVGLDGESQLLFVLEGREITRISGGIPAFCE